MLGLGLSAAVQQAYHVALSQPYRAKTVVQVLDLEHNVLADISHMVDDGQIDGQVVRLENLKNDLKDVNDPSILHTLSMTLIDPRRTLGFDSSSPADAAVYLDRMIRVYYCIYVPAFARWVDCPEFTGPITDLSRDDAIVTIEAQSKEALSAGECNTTRTFKGATKVDTIRDLLKMTGEIDKYIDLPALTSKPAKDTVLVRESRPWAKAFALGESMTRHLFYDARGVARMADPNAKAVFTFNGENITKFPGARYGTGDLRNGVRVIAGTGSGTKPKYDQTAYAPSTNPNSRENLGRNGVKRNYIETIADDDIKSASAALTRAKSELADRLRTVTAINLESFCIPHLELWDLVEVDLPNLHAELRVESFSKPITVKSLMTVGYTARITAPPLSKIRRP